VLLLGLAGPAFGADGVLEINATCATTAGCFAGDTPGYPVQITQPGSYRLTGNLTVPAGTNGIEVANGVDLDLGGFEIAGPVSCALGCPAAGSGSGIAAAPFGGNQCAVSNGKLRGFAEDGVRLGLQGDARRLRITDIARHGLNLGGGSFAAENLINRIGQNGIRFNVSGFLAPSLYRDNTIANTAGQSVVDGKANGPNVCPDQLCGTSGKKFFYLTTVSHDGASADVACAVGFHLASLWEIFDPSALEYDTARGRTTTDSGQGPPSETTGLGSRPGWLRTGNLGGAHPTAGVGNCSGWTSSSSAQNGTAALPDQVWTGTPSPAQNLPPWQATSPTCDQLLPVWCVQD